MNYPNNWPCKNCKKLRGEHYQIIPKGGIWCSEGFIINTEFVPIDNLSYIEREANARAANL